MIALGTALALRRAVILPLTAATVWLADLIALAIKVAVSRPRPFTEFTDTEPLLLGTVAASFPSGHAATSFAGAAILSRFLPGRWPVLFLLAAAISFSRIYVGHHYPADVLAGAILGLATAIALPPLAGALRRSRREPPPG